MDFIGCTITVVLMSGIAAACDSQSLFEAAAQTTPATTTAPASSPPTSQPASQPRGSTRAQPVISLLDFGQPPYQALRYSPRAGDKQIVELAIRTSDKPEEGKAQLPGQNYPEIKLTIEVRVQEVSPDGSIHYSLAFTHGDAVNDPAVMPAIVERFRKSANAVVGVTAAAEVTDRGAVTKWNLKIPEGAEAAVATVLRKAEIALEQLWTMLPEEPIGLGGKWRTEHESDTSANNAHFKHSVEYQVSSLEGGQVRLTAVVHDQGDRQSMKSTGPNNPYKMVLASYTGTGRGETKLDLTQVMPLLAEVFVQTTSNVEIQMDGSVQPVSARFVIEGRMETKSK